MWQHRKWSTYIWKHVTCTRKCYHHMGVYAHWCTHISCSAIIVLVTSFGNGVCKMPSSCMIMLQPTQQRVTNILWPWGWEALQHLPTLLTLCFMFTLCATIKPWFRTCGLLAMAAVHIPPSDCNIYKYMPHTFKCIYSVPAFLHFWPWLNGVTLIFIIPKLVGQDRPWFWHTWMWGWVQAYFPSSFK
jgi:hypothetical protein